MHKVQRKCLCSWLAHSLHNHCLPPLRWSTTFMCQYSRLVVCDAKLQRGLSDQKSRHDFSESN